MSLSKFVAELRDVAECCLHRRTRRVVPSHRCSGRSSVGVRANAVGSLRTRDLPAVAPGQRQQHDSEFAR